MTKPPSRTCPRTGSEFGFTVIELLVAFSIITVLIALLVLGMEPMRERARRVVCMNNIRQIGLAMLTYADDHDEHPFTAVDPSAGTQVTFNTGIGSHWYELRNYLKHPGILYCPSALKKHLVSGTGWDENAAATTWADVPNKKSHYGYISYYAPPPSSAYILAFENFNYRWHGVEWYPQSNPGLTSYDFILCSDNAYAPTDPNPPSSFYYPDANHVKLVGEANPWYLADPMPPDPGCHVVYADGRVEWKKGRRFGPFYTYDVPPGNGAWWSSFYSRGIVVAR